MLTHWNNRIIELNVQIICACLPCLRALAGRIMPSLLPIQGKPKPLGLETITVSGVASTLEPEPIGQRVVEKHHHIQPPNRVLSRESSTMYGSERASSRGGDNWV